MDTITLVTGGNRGIGLEVCRQLALQGHTVLLCSRDRAKGEEAARTLSVPGAKIIPRQVDITDASSIIKLRAAIENEWGRLDVLVNNASINFDYQQTTVNAELNDVRRTLETNLFGAWRMCQALLPLIRKSGHGRIVNVSSEAGSFLAPQGMPARGGVLPAYCISKAAFNALTVKLAAALKSTGILVNAVCPGFTAGSPATDAAGARPVAEDAASVVWAATLPDDGPTGGFFRDGKPLPW